MIGINQTPRTCTKPTQAANTNKPAFKAVYGFTPKLENVLEEEIMDLAFNCGKKETKSIYKAIHNEFHSKSGLPRLTGFQMGVHKSNTAEFEAKCKKQFGFIPNRVLREQVHPDIKAREGYVE